MKSKLLLTCFFVFLSISFVSAQLGYSNPDLPKLEKTSNNNVTYNVNYTTFATNNYINQTTNLTNNITNNITTINNLTNNYTYNIYGANVSSITCPGSDKVSAIDNATGIVTCTSDNSSVYYAGSNLTQTGTTFDVNASSLKDWLSNFFQAVGSYLTSESDPFWTGNYSNFTGSYANQVSNASNFSIGYLYAVNSTGDYIDNSHGYYNSTNIPNFLLAVNWNATNSSYYVDNSHSYYNSTNIPNFLLANNWNATNISYYVDNIHSYYNSTTIPNFLLVSDWNATNTSYIRWIEAINGTLMPYSAWNSTNTSYYLQTNPFSFYNSTTIPNFLLASDFVAILVSPS
jgi:hypothetical protein